MINISKVLLMISKSTDPLSLPNKSNVLLMYVINHVGLAVTELPTNVTKKKKKTVSNSLMTKFYPEINLKTKDLKRVEKDLLLITPSNSMEKVDTEISVKPSSEENKPLLSGPDSTLTIVGRELWISETDLPKIIYCSPKKEFLTTSLSINFSTIKPI